MFQMQILPHQVMSLYNDPEQNEIPNVSGENGDPYQLPRS